MWECLLIVIDYFWGTIYWETYNLLLLRIIFPWEKKGKHYLLVSISLWSKILPTGCALPWTFWVCTVGSECVLWGSHTTVTTGKPQDRRLEIHMKWVAMSKWSWLSLHRVDCHSVGWTWTRDQRPRRKIRLRGSEVAHKKWLISRNVLLASSFMWRKLK